MSEVFTLDLQAIYRAWRADYIRLLIQSGAEPSVPNAVDFLARAGSPEHYRSLGGQLVCEWFPATGL